MLIFPTLRCDPRHTRLVQANLSPLRYARTHPFWALSATFETQDAWTLRRNKL